MLPPPYLEYAKVLHHIPSVAIDCGDNVAQYEEPGIRVAKCIRITICKRLPESECEEMVGGYGLLD